MNPSIKSENLNAIKLHLILLNVTTKALHSKLEEEIQNRNPGPNSVQTFLETNYNTASNRTDPHLKGFFKTLNPNFPRRRQNNPFPNDLKLFDLTACYSIARNLLNLPDLSDYDEVRQIRNDFYAHLNFLEIDDATFNQKVTRLEVLTDHFSTAPTFKLENRRAIEKIKNLKEIVEFDINSINNYTQFVLKIFGDKKGIFDSSLKKEIQNLINHHHSSDANQRMELAQIYDDFKSLLSSIGHISTAIQASTQEQKNQFSKAVMEHLEQSVLTPINDNLDEIKRDVKELKKSGKQFKKIILFSIFLKNLNKLLQFLS